MCVVEASGIIVWLLPRVEVHATSVFTTPSCKDICSHSTPGYVHAALPCPRCARCSAPALQERLNALTGRYLEAPQGPTQLEAYVRECAALLGLRSSAVGAEGGAEAAKVGAGGHCRVGVLQAGRR